MAFRAIGPKLTLSGGAPYNQALGRQRLSSKGSEFRMKIHCLPSTLVGGLLLAVIYSLAADGQDEKPNLKLPDLLFPALDPGTASTGNHVSITGSFTVQKGGRRGTLS